MCHIPLKSDVEVWEKHLKSTQHAMRQERLRLSTSQRPKSTNLPERPEGASTREVSAGSKKRKADDGDGDTRKRTRPVIDVQAGLFNQASEANSAGSQHTAKNHDQIAKRGDTVTKHPKESIRVSGLAPSLVPSLASEIQPTSPTTLPPTAPIDEDEWAAFERDVATPPPDPTAPSALTAAATIIAAPLTAAELAAQSREQASLQGREKREAEMEGEKEDAARALEDEFDEMEGLEDRVRRLREKREKLRLRRAEEVEEGLEDDGEREVEGKGAVAAEEDEESEDEEDDGGWGAWGR